MWHFLEGVLFLSVEKNVKQRPVPYTHQDVTFRRHFFASDEKKKEAGATAFYGGKPVNALSCLHGKVTDCGYL